jgi:hypothetical protein
VPGARGGLRRGFVHLDEDVALRVIPGRNLMTPPELARHAPGLDVLHPAEEVVLAARRHENHVALAHGLDRPLGELLGIHIPLLGQERLERHAAAIAVGHAVSVRLDLLDQIQRLQLAHQLLAGLEPIQAMVLVDDRDGGVPRQAFQEVGVVLQQQPGELVEYADGAQPVAAADLEIVEVVCRRDLHGTGTFFRIGVFVGDDGHAAARHRQDGVAADQVLPGRVLGMHGDGGVAQHGLGPRRGHDDVAALVALDRVADVPEAALDLLRLDLEVGDRRQHLRIPVDQALVLVEQALFVEVDEHLQHGVRQTFVHGEALAPPVA